ncbi:bromodomain-containing protein DDB_G0270170 [Bactrocera tryoni]|uniref:bromodomain-containing protein DDB_G0270170 n=1 Tax=Bactrocera tryoni TaxID=59916 RepID=UPI001A962567|nr:bromodomain-containing protein DDB_G0270170 [Bactrocera tryoni]
MAGIQLTGADEHMSPAFMSGATPTATVEEINVPVFIDEYLQQPAATHTEAATNINNYSQISSNSSNSSSSSNICHSISSGNGSNANNNIINGNGFVDFEFDIDMFLDGSDAETYNNNHSNNNNKNNNSSTTSMSNNTLNNNGIDMADIDDTFLSCINNTNNNNYIINNNSNANNNQWQQPINIKYENSENLSEFDLSNDLLLSTDISTAIDDFMPEFFECSEQAININGLDFGNLLNNSQDPMLPCTSSTPSNSQQLSVNRLEPIVPKIEEHDEVPCDDDNMLVEIEDMDIATPIIIPSLSSLPSNSSRMQQKRLKLHLPSAHIADPLSTPTVLGGIVDLQVEQMAIGSTNYGETTIDDIVEVLQDPSSHPLIYNEEDLPPTPRSYTSTSTYTNEYMPSSPSPSNISSNQQMNSNKKKRGRPAKDRSDQPDPSKLLKMSEAERKKLMDRAKNNEASRVSRRKNKLREEREIRLENELLEANNLRQAELMKLNKIKDKLKRALKRGLSNTRPRSFN